MKFFKNPLFNKEQWSQLNKSCEKSLKEFLEVMLFIY